jgi:phosphoserine phosphatase RsbU/P
VLHALVGTWAGRAVLIGGGVKLASLIARRLIGIVDAVEIIGSLGTLVLLIGLAYYLARLVSVAREHLLWRVRRKLILSYIFVGLIPALLIISFCLLCGLMLFGSVSQYIVSTRLRTSTDQAQFLARTVAIEVGRLSRDSDVAAFLERKQNTLETRYSGASLALVPVSRACPGAETPAVAPELRLARALAAGPWHHAIPPASVPNWVPCTGFTGVVAHNAAQRGAAPQTQLAVRASAFASSASPRYAVVLDLPVDANTARRLREETGIDLRAVSAENPQPPAAPAGAPLVDLDAGSADDRRRQLDWVAMLDFVDWETGRPGQATLAIGMSIGEIYDRLSPSRLGRMSVSQGVIVILIVVAILFLFIQFVALVFGLALARSITGSIHELFVGTVQVQQGDFSHKIEVKARDQLGELANSFNAMTSRLTSLLAEMAEKKRLEEELRIARDIQMSLLPQGPLRMAGLQMTAHCSPAREVGGDYYDFFAIDDQRVGILIADVSGKGTSAALYMAELKGLMLSLTQIHTSPRELMIAANRIIAHNLDARSFITMTYAVLDMGARTMTYARAGHTPLIHLTGRGMSRRARILIPDGMVLGLKFDRGEKFASALEEVTLPLESGDLFALFTDGISEAMNGEDELFGENRLSRLIEDHAELPFDELRERILREVRDFAGDPGPHDDMTLILLKVDDAGVAAVQHTDRAVAIV